jgi:hypothetical protein
MKLHPDIISNETPLTAEEKLGIRSFKMLVEYAKTDNVSMIEAIENLNGTKYNVSLQ